MLKLDCAVFWLNAQTVEKTLQNLTNHWWIALFAFMHTHVTRAKLILKLYHKKYYFFAIDRKTVISLEIIISKPCLATICFMQSISEGCGVQYTWSSQVLLILLCTIETAWASLKDLQTAIISFSSEIVSCLSNALFPLVFA